MSPSLRLRNKAIRNSSCPDGGNRHAQNLCRSEKKPSWPSNVQKRRRDVRGKMRRAIGSGKRRWMRGRDFARPWLKQDLEALIGRGSLGVRAKSYWKKCRGWWDLESMMAYSITLFCTNRRYGFRSNSAFRVLTIPSPTHTYLTAANLSWQLLISVQVRAQTVHRRSTHRLTITLPLRHSLFLRSCTAPMWWDRCALYLTGRGIYSMSH